MYHGIKKEKIIKRKNIIAKNITDAVDITSDKSDHAQIHTDLGIGIKILTVWMYSEP